MVEKYLVKPIGKVEITELGYLEIDIGVLEALEEKYSFKLTRDTTNFPMLRNFYSKELKFEMEGRVLRVLEVIVVELKPKMGVVEPLLSEGMLERTGGVFKVPYCVLKEKKEIKLGLKKISTHYDPRMLYSGDQKAMEEAVSRLSSTPNRYWNVKTINSPLDTEDKA